MSTLETIYLVLCVLALTSIILPIIHKDHWIFRAFEFPRLQKFTFFVVILCLGLFIPFHNEYIWIFQTLLLAGTLYSAYMILPYTPFSDKHLKAVSPANARDKVKILISNVYQPNTKYNLLKDRINQENPDIIFLVETDPEWCRELEALDNIYPFKISVPLDNMYGLLFYTRLRVLDHKILYRIKDDIPSIEVIMKTHGGREFTYVGVHPEPPSPTENPYSTDRDMELLQVAKECAEIHEPVIIAGDLNDVAWSYTTQRFLKVSGLKDPRMGRGIYSTFHAKYLLLRWPLDHLFCSSHFKLVQMRRLKNINSDHFPVLVELSMEQDHLPRSSDKKKRKKNKVHSK